MAPIASRMSNRLLTAVARLHHHEVGLKPHAQDVLAGLVTGVRPNIYFSWDLIPRHVVIRLLLVDAVVSANGEAIRSKNGNATLKKVAIETEGSRRRHTEADGVDLVRGFLVAPMKDEDDIRREPEACDHCRAPPFPR